MRGATFWRSTPPLLRMSSPAAALAWRDRGSLRVACANLDRRSHTSTRSLQRLDPVVQAVDEDEVEALLAAARRIAPPFRPAGPPPARFGWRSIP